MSNQHISITSPQAFDPSCIQVATQSVSQACKPTPKKYENTGKCPVCGKWQKFLSAHKSRTHGLKRPPPAGRRVQCTKCKKEWSAKNRKRNKCPCNAEIISFRTLSIEQIPGCETVGSGSQNSDDHQPFSVPQISSGGANDPTVVTALTDRSIKRQRKLPSVYLLCIVIAPPSAQDIANDDLVGVKVDLTDHEILQTPLASIINDDVVSKLKEDLGNAFVSETNGEPVLHQSVLTALYAGALSHVKSEIRGYPWVQEQLRNDSLVEHIRSMEVSQVLLWVSNNTSAWPGMSMTEFYEHMRKVSDACGNPAICLSQTEADQEEFKIGDIEAFDEIAKNAPNSRYKYRPKTCFGTGTCSLPGDELDDQVLKRSHSCGAADVKLGSSPERQHLKCIKPGAQRLTRSQFPDPKEPRWFHQERVKSLEDFGEFRIIFIEDKMAYAVRTKFEDKDGKKVIAVKPLELSDFYWSKSQKLKMHQLFAFAAYIRANLLKRGDSEEHYGSLRVGVRIDIGVSELSEEGDFFVVEVARIPADSGSNN
ncbi:hypothetical protein FocnCong_v011437 [Fusarium oxysporum f. sp. conglutinans]|nr:hypothetical protein FocnCong_v011437 [Fusarium oxysporum f. sp. conglutinans]